ncbi:MAG: SDR family NAD(P)-dependent oxidoreductase [Firmicutes bacterium]|nr:SDR family NAD(P)-dependent oxidoreductase [Bacillota bacterium]
MEVRGSVFIVTGGASGLGRATAEVLSEAGAQVAVWDIAAEAGAAVAQAVGGTFYPVDVTDEQAVAMAVEAVVRQYGGLQGVVNCAGVGVAARVLGRRAPHPLDLFERTVRVNAVGTFNVIRWAARAISQGAARNADGERGVIINTASIAAYDGQIGQAAYAASKGAVVGMTLPIARELAAFGIRVVAIAPGVFDTPMLGMLPDAARHSLAAQVPFPSRLGQPREYGLLARHIVENPMINGAVIRLDGALRMPPR